MKAKLTRLTHKIAIQLYLVEESCTIFSSRSRRPVQKLLDTPTHLNLTVHERRSFEKFLDSAYYYESELCEGAVTVSFSKHLP
jgi:hypothetical protein